MNRLILLAVLVAALPWLDASGQAPVVGKRADLTLSAGAGVPIGDFGSTSSNRAGGAKLGYNFSAALTVHVIEFFDVGALTTVNFNGFNSEELENQLQLPVGTLDADQYINMGFFGVAGFNTPMTQDNWFYGQVFAGFMMSKSPEVRGSYQTQTFLIPSATAYPLAYGIGAGVRIYSVDVSAKYMACEPEYEITSGSTTMRAKQPTAILQLTIGYIIPF